VIEEIAADTALYRVGATAGHEIVAFVWDHSRSTDQHGELGQGIRRLSGIRDVVIVSRPGRWTDPER
jgi:REase_DpnII-MboI